MVGRPLAFKDDSVWAVGSKYYVNGKPNNISVATILATDPNDIRKQLEEYGPLNSGDGFKRYKTAFVEANKEHLGALVREASDFIVKASEGYPDEHLVVSFSGGKDSTVTADLAVRALSNPYLVHIFGNTTLEFPSTIEYAKRFRDNHPLAIFKVAKNYEQDFYDVANVIGPPARTMRWCCSMFKTGPISRAFKGLFGDEPILTFYGIRKNESVSRSKYNRIEDSAESVKIQRQKVASPIFYWNDCDVWLYRYNSDRSMTMKDLLAEKQGYSQLKAFNTGEVYGCNVAKTLFYEQSPFRPDYLLSDFIQIFHPDLKGLHPLRYYFKINN